MKKLFLLGLCFMAVAGASAQKSLVKEVEGKSKGFEPILPRHVLSLRLP